MIDHDALSAMIRRRRKVGAGGLLPELPAAYLDLYDEVTRLRAERDRFETALGRACQVGGTTYLVERAEKAEAERDALRAALTIYAQSGNWRLGGCCDPNSPNFTGEAIARQALKGQPND